MKVRVEGWKRVDYVSNKTGKNVKGWNIYVTREPSVSESEYITGRVCEDLYVPDTFDIKSVAIGFDFNVVYNRYGGVEEIQAL